MKIKSICVLAVVLGVCCQYGQAQLAESNAGYAAVGFDDPAVPVPSPKMLQAAPVASPGYASLGYASPGYAAPGYAAPGYAAPGYAAPGYAAPGYVTPISAAPISAAPAVTTSDGVFRAAWDSIGQSLSAGCEPSCGGCDSPGGSCSTAKAGCRCAPSWQFFADFLYLRPRSAEVLYAAPIGTDGVAPPDPIQTGRLGVVDFEYDPAYRAGFTCALDDCASLGVTYTQYEGKTRDAIVTTYPYAVRAMADHPWTSVPDGYLAVAATGIDFDLVDMDYRGMMLCSERHAVNYLAGLRYAYLEQGFFSRFGLGSQETAFTDIRFDGGGIRLGLEGERYLMGGGSGLMIYGRGLASFVAGEFESQYRQDGNARADACFNTGRIVPILDLELGAGWTLWDGRLRFSGGYVFSAWYNVLKTDDFIQAIRAQNPSDLSSQLTFDGLVMRAECRF